MALFMSRAIGWNISMIQEASSRHHYPRLREIDRHLEFLPFSYNCSNSCCLLTKLLGCFPIAHPSLVKVYYCIPDALPQLSGLGHCGEVGVCLIECVDRCLSNR
ncbi:hypothetical protein GOODEAATRI_004364 [Goodea atripinnis]|uniref:Uncharacterized protein n=1 Tax=Goodea atripinnis TaxID=208336 RepID=A0ABV0NTE4_9TELE